MLGVVDRVCALIDIHHDYEAVTQDDLNDIIRRIVPHGDAEKWQDTFKANVGIGRIGINLDRANAFVVVIQRVVAAIVEKRSVVAAIEKESRNFLRVVGASRVV